jgi:aspartyl-tRNA(Asn)/glutamyl-tRNA(Gln) amidotransferase subunit A
MKALDLTLAEAADGLARGEFTSVDLTRAALERAGELGPRLNCIARLDAEDALAQAEAADRDRRAGRSGPLLGVPLAHKDLFYVRGKVAACGSKIRRDFVPETTATVLTRLADAGAVNVGSLHMAEFAFSPSGYNEHYGHARNPWNPAHVPGGSSSGSGAAVAARIVYGSLGTDTGGSIRHPAAMCGITGLKPTVTRVSRAGAMPLSFSLDCVGPLARTARDCARLMDAIAGPDPADPTASTEPVSRYEQALDGNLRGLKIGVARDYYYDPVTLDVAHHLEESLATFRALGATITEVKVPDVDLINTLMHVLMTAEAATVHRKWLETRRADYSLQVRSRIEPGLFYPATRYLEALSMRAAITREFVATAMMDVDVLHLPAIPIPVPSIEDSTTGPDVMRIIGTLGHCTRGLNYLGLPAISVPAGFDGKGLPIGFQLVARPFAEATLLRTADAYQRVTDWHKRKP